MSSIVPQRGIVRKLYENANNDDIEYKSSAFWQGLLQMYYRVEEDYLPLCEQSPDGGRSRVDITIVRYDAEYHEIVICKVVEAKRIGGNSPKAAEVDVLASAMKVLEYTDTQFLYAMSTWGTKFRLWLVDKSDGKLHPG